MPRFTAPAGQRYRRPNDPATATTHKDNDMRPHLIACLATLAATPVAAKAPDDPSFQLVNRGAQPIIELFATPAGMTNWGESRLGGHRLPPGAATQIRIPRSGNCLFDLRVVFADHTALEKRHDDLCRITDLPVP